MNLIRDYKPNKNPTISSYYSLRSTNKIATVWEYLGRYKSPSYTKNVIAKLIIKNKCLLGQKAEQLALSIKQAEQYFISARIADVSIQPLLIYYGIVGLSKCLIISGDNKYLLDTNLDSEDYATHGLSWKANFNNSVEVTTRNSLSLVDEFCKVKATGLYPLFRSCYCDNPIPKDTKITIKTLLSLIGEDWKKYHDFFSEPPNVYKCWNPKDGGVENIGDEKQIIGGFDDYFHLFHKQGSETVEQTLDRLFPELNALYVEAGDRCFKSKDPLKSMDSHIVFSETQTLDTFALIQPSLHYKLTDFDIYYLLFFILGSLARYSQNKWFSLIQRQDPKDEFFLIQNLFEIVQYKFPLLILKELEQKDYRFVGEVATLG